MIQHLEKITEDILKLNGIIGMQLICERNINQDDNFVPRMVVKKNDGELIIDGDDNITTFVNNLIK